MAEGISFVFKFCVVLYSDPPEIAGATVTESDGELVGLLVFTDTEREVPDVQVTCI